MSGRASSPGHRRARLAWSRLIRPPIGRYAAPPILARPGIVAGPPSRCGKPCSWRGDGCGKSSSRGRISRKSGDFADSWKNGRSRIDGEARAEGDRNFTPREIGAFGASRRTPAPGFVACPGFRRRPFRWPVGAARSSGPRSEGPFHSPQVEARAAKPQGPAVGPVRTADPASEACGPPPRHASVDVDARPSSRPPETAGRELPPPLAWSCLLGASRRARLGAGAARTWRAAFSTSSTASRALKFGRGPLRSRPGKDCRESSRKRVRGIRGFRRFSEKRTSRDRRRGASGGRPDLYPSGNRRFRSVETGSGAGIWRWPGSSAPTISLAGRSCREFRASSRRTFNSPQAEARAAQPQGSAVGPVRIAGFASEVGGPPPLSASVDVDAGSSSRPAETAGRKPPSLMASAVRRVAIQRGG